MRDLKAFSGLLSDLTIDGAKDFLNKAITNLTFSGTLAGNLAGGGHNITAINELTFAKLMSNVDVNSKTLTNAFLGAGTKLTAGLNADSQTITNAGNWNFATGKYLRAADIAGGLFNIYAYDAGTPKKVATVQGGTPASFDLRKGRLLADLRCEEFNFVGINHLAGDILIASSDTERNTDATDLTKLKEITFRGRGTLRIKYEYKRTGEVTTVNCHVYKNGVSVHNPGGTTSSSYVSVSVDLADWTENDLVQLYAATNSAPSPVFIRNFRIYCYSPRNLCSLELD